MHHSAITMILLALIPAFTLGTPTITAQRATEDLATAQMNWWLDTGRVSQFLSESPSLTGQDLATQAGLALGFENDELNHKNVIDAALGNNPNIQKANNTLVVQGTFQVVVNGLMDLATNGSGYTAAQVIAAVASINNDRCKHVLPAIDIYLHTTSSYLGNANAFPLFATRPLNCPC
jgi:hypothetical protein